MIQRIKFSIARTNREEFRAFSFKIRKKGFMSKIKASSANTFMIRMRAGIYGLITMALSITTAAKLLQSIDNVIGLYKVIQITLSKC